MRSSTSHILQCCDNPRLKKTLLLFLFLMSMAVGFGGVGYLIGYLATSESDTAQKSAAGVGTASAGAAAGLIAATLILLGPARYCCGRIRCYCSLNDPIENTNDNNQNREEKATSFDQENGIVQERELTPARKDATTPAAPLLTSIYASYTHPDKHEDEKKFPSTSSATAGNVGAVVHSTKKR